MKIVADRDILDALSGFGDLGELVLVSGRDMTANHLADAGALVVRSITQVDEALLTGSSVRFVGTATSGVNHIDQQFLKENGIGFVSAKGSNANAVVDYVFAALAYAVIDKSLSVQNCTVGIVGAGAVGGLLASKLEKVGINFKLCDPPLKDKGVSSEQVYCSLEEVMHCDIVTLHVPLIHDGEYPTANLISVQHLSLLPENAVLINACRGGVVDEEALKTFLRDRKDIGTVFDVWQNEPLPDPGLVAAIDVATPHIAGYSQEAKSAATAMMRTALADFIGGARFDHAEGVLGDKDHYPKATVSLLERDVKNAIDSWQCILNAMPIVDISSRFKSAVVDGEVGVFDTLRSELKGRREFLAMKLKAQGNNAIDDSQHNFLQAVGFEFSS